MGKPQQVAWRGYAGMDKAEAKQQEEGLSSRACWEVRQQDLGRNSGGSRIQVQPSQILIWFLLGGCQTPQSTLFMMVFALSERGSSLGFPLRLQQKEFSSLSGSCYIGVHLQAPLCPVGPG